MKPTTDRGTPDETTARTRRRGNLYFAMAFALLVGFLVVGGLGVVGVASLGLLSVTTAMAMIAIAITLLGVASFATMVTLRRTLALVSEHAAALSQQSARHAELAALVQSQWHADQVMRDRDQDRELAAVSARQDASFIEGQSGSTRGRPSRAVRAWSGRDPFAHGQVHPVRDIEGVGEHYGRLLESVSLTDTRKLWRSDATYVAGGLKVQPAVVESWQAMAELMAVTGIGKQYAELIVRADVRSIEALAAQTVESLLERIRRLEGGQEHRLQGNTIGPRVVQSWITAARTHYRPSANVPIASDGSVGPGA